MPLSVKDLSLTLLLAAGLIGFPPAAGALEAVLNSRQPLCSKPQSACPALFNLNSQEKVEVLEQSQDQGWLQVRYPRNGQIGWIPANSAQLILPSTMRYKSVFQFAPSSFPVFVLSDPAGSAQGPQILAGKQLFALNTSTEQLEPPLPLRFLSSSADLLSPCQARLGEVNCVKKIEMDKQSYLQLQSEKTAQNYPDYTTLLRQEKGQTLAQVAFAPDFSPTFALQATGFGAWGKSVFALYQESGESLRAVLPNTKDIFAFVPSEMRSKIRSDTLEMVALESNGILHVVAGQFARKERLLMRFQITSEPPWKYLGQITWPESLPWSLGKGQPRIQVATQGQDTWLALAPAQDPEKFELYFFSVTGTPLFHAAVPGLRSLWLDSQARLWSLEGDQLVMRQAVFEAEKP
jgi:hypothetical protein